jgi:hypothetical protein
MSAGLWRLLLWPQMLHVPHRQRSESVRDDSAEHRCSLGCRRSFAAGNYPIYELEILQHFVIQPQVVQSLLKYQVALEKKCNSNYYDCYVRPQRQRLHFHSSCWRRGR